MVRLWFNLLLFCIHKFIFRESTGKALKFFCKRMGIVYIKLDQILATRNYGTLFTEEDRQDILSIVDNCKPIKYEEISSILHNTYKSNEIKKVFKKPIGKASISQVHKAILVNGDIVVLKIKRKDLEKTIKTDIHNLKLLLLIFGRFVKFTNLFGGNKALDMYISWIEEEIDFEKEVYNLEEYYKFAERINGKVKNCVDIKVPKVYKELCTKDIIVMEYIPFETLNNISLTEENKTKIAKGINSYLQLSFYALLNDKGIVWHGDPHPGNIYFDEKGNIGFLDLGLMFQMDNNERNMTIELFMLAYYRNADKLYEMLEPYAGGKNKNKTKEELKDKLNLYCKTVRYKPITCYFTDLMDLCLDLQFCPPDFLFRMAKAFVCLSGIDTFVGNKEACIDVLEEQVLEYNINNMFNCLDHINDIGKKVVNIGLRRFLYTKKKIEGYIYDIECNRD